MDLKIKSIKIIIRGPAINIQENDQYSGKMKTKQREYLFTVHENIL